MRRQRGSAFLVALIAIVVLSLIVTSFSQQLGTDLRAQTNRLDRWRAEQMARAGIERALVELANQNVNLISDTDTAIALGQDGAENFLVGGGAFRVQVVDAGAQLNLNTMDQARWERIGLEADLIDAILDWRGPETQPRAQGAKDEYYNALQTPYNTKLGDFDSVEELLLVRGMTPDLLYRPAENTTSQPLITGQDEDQPALYELLTVDSAAPNTRADGTARINANNATVAQLVQAGLTQPVANAIVQRRYTVGTFTGFEQILQTPGLTLAQAQTVLDALTTTAETEVRGKVNLNTASEAVLNALGDLTADNVQAIISRQGSFASLGELATLGGMTIETLRAVADDFTVGANVFSVRSVGTFGSQTVALVATVRVENGAARVLRVTPYPLPDPELAWDWPEETTAETVLLEAA